jgi:sec-independent protein translocase protein TatB
MDILGVGPLELIFVLIIAILIIGPRDLGKTAKTLGRFLNRVYKSDEWRALTEASRTLRTLPNRLAREAELEELNEIKESIQETAQDLKQSQQALSKEAQTTISKLTLNSEDEDAMKAWTTPPAVSRSSGDPAEGPSEDDPKITQEES